MKTTAIITGTITLEAPLSISLPVAQQTRENEWKNALVMPRGSGKTGYLPATTLRGALRRGAALSQYQEGQTYAMPTLYADLIGQTKDKEEEAVDLLGIERERAAKPVIDLFGAGMGFNPPACGSLLACRGRAAGGPDHCAQRLG